MDGDPGCISGVFHAFDYRYWRKFSKGGGKSKTLSSAKQKNYRLIGSRLQKQPKFQRTLSIHHLECSDYVPKVSIQSDIEVKNVPKNMEIDEETSLDFWELYRANKDFFSKIQKYTDGGIEKSFCNMETRKARVKLVRSGSYPLPKSSKARSFKPSKLDHKELEIWSHSDIDNLSTLPMNESSLGKYDKFLTKWLIWEPKMSLSKSLKLTNESSFKRVQFLSRIYSTNSYKEMEISDFLDSMRENCTDDVVNVSEEMEDQLDVLKDPEKEEEIGFIEIPEDVILHHSSRYDDLNYVRDILVRSGFDRNDNFAPWYSLDQPLDPAVFYDMKACLPHKEDFCCHHQLLFDLTNEILVQIYDTLFTYYPRASSSSCHVPPISKKFSVLDEVWSIVKKGTNLELGLDPTVEDIVTQEMWSNDTSMWMNLQLESEFVALELEDMFFGELLEEIISY